jgi:hypothetical protein
VHLENIAKKTFKRGRKKGGMGNRRGDKNGGGLVVIGKKGWTDTGHTGLSLILSSRGKVSFTCYSHLRESACVGLTGRGVDSLLAYFHFQHSCVGPRLRV